MSGDKCRTHIPFYPCRVEFHSTMSEEGLLLQDSSGMDLQFRGVGASLGGRQILQDVSGVVRRGEMLAIMGASGEYTWKGGFHI